VSGRKQADKRLMRREKKYEIERLMREKRSEEYEVLEEVFDRSTLLTVYDFLNKGVIEEIFGVVSAGKEARIYWGKDREGNELAIKIYLTISAEFRRGKLPYLEGDPRFAHIKGDTRSVVYAWAQKEFKNLQRACKVGVQVPKPVAIKNNVLIMEFIGEGGYTAPILKEVSLRNPAKMYQQLLDYVEKLYQEAELVHGDLSEYNIMVWRGKPVLFDISQAVLLEHPMAKQLLKRDLKNLRRYFEKLRINVLSVNEMYRRVTGGES
jgi:RIO kinase 1